MSAVPDQPPDSSSGRWRASTGLAALWVVVAATSWWLYRASGSSWGDAATVAGLTAVAGVTSILYLLRDVLLRRIRARSLPDPVPPDRLYAVTLPARGGWLAQFLDPATRGVAAVYDESLVIRCRRARNHFVLFALGLMFVPGPDWVRVAGWCTALGLWAATALLLRRERHPWDTILAAHAAGPRFHLEIAGEAHRAGLLLELADADRERFAAVLRAKTRLEEA